MITVIGSKNCARCKIVKQALVNKKVEFSYKDYENLNETELKELEKLGAKTLPIVKVDDKFVDFKEVLK